MPALLLSQNHLKAHLWVRLKIWQFGGQIQAVLINSGVANACTGEKGIKDAWETVGYVAESLKIPAQNVAVTSTGKIGEFLPLDKIKNGVEKAAEQLSFEGGTEADEALLTIDTRQKEMAEVLLDGKN